jgi:hypothetical protein
MSLTSLIANWLVALAYFGITWILHVHRMKGVWRFNDTVVFKAFIFLCGVHHLVMPIGSREVLLGVDIGLAVVSVGCAFLIWKDSRVPTV